MDETTATPNNTKLTPALIKRLADFIKQGIPQRTMCRMAGVSDRAYRNWRRWGRDGTHGGIYAEFVRDLDQAEAALAASLTIAWHRDAKRDWRAARAWLESRCPDEWGSGRRRPRAIPQPPVVINVTLASGQRLEDAIPPGLLMSTGIDQRATVALRSPTSCEIRNGA